MSRKKLGSSDYTPTKQKIFNTVLSGHLAKCQAIIKKWEGTIKKPMVFNYIDLNAGSGIYEGVVGSPIVFLEQIKDINNLKINAILVEKDIQCFSKLRDIISNDYGHVLIKHNINISLVNGDNSMIVNYFNNLSCNDMDAYGLIYNDPNGGPDFDLLRDVLALKINKKMDVLINCNTTSIKRVRCRFNDDGYAQQKYITLEESLCQLNKKHWLIREDSKDGWNWSLMLGTNWDNYKLPNNHFNGYSVRNGKIKPIGKNGMRRLQAIDLFNRLNLTKDEMEWRQ